MAAIPLSFSYSGTPSLFPQLTSEAKAGLERDPKTFKPLKDLVKYLVGQPSPDFEEPLSTTPFRDRPGAVQRLTPLSARFWEQLTVTQTALANPTPERLAPLLRELSAAHRAYRDQWVREYEAAAPYEPFTILNRYPKTVRLYLTAFFDELQKLSREEFAQSRQAVIEKDEALLPIFSRLAIHYLLKKQAFEIPELFNRDQISNLRIAYRELSSDAQKALGASLRGEPNSGLAHQIARLDYSSRGQAFNGVLRLVYEEAEKIFPLIEKMPTDEAVSFEGKCRKGFLALLKQENLTEETLPRSFHGKEIKGKVVDAHQKYQALNEGQKREFEKLFLREADDSEDQAIYTLLQDWRRVIFDWPISSPIPFCWASLSQS